MRRIVYFIYILGTIWSTISCSDDLELSVVNGNWNYLKPYFEIEYATDSIVLEMNQGQKMSIAVSDLREMFMGMAGQKMQAYFKGIEFISGEQLMLKARTAKGIPVNFPVSYRRTRELLQLTLDQKQMQGFLGETAANIPPVSLKYFTGNDQMTIYLDEVYLQVIYSMMEENIITMMVEEIVPAFDRMPLNIQTKIKEGFTTQIRGIFDNMIRLQAGFVLTREE